MVLPTGGAWQRRSPRPGRWQPPCGLRCRAMRRLSTASSATRLIRWGTLTRPSVPRQASGDCKGGGRPGGAGQGVREPGQRVSVAGGLQQGHRSRLAIAKEVSDRAGEARACGNLGSGHLYLNKSNLYLFLKAVAYFEAQHALAISLKLAHMQSDAALNMGVALTLHVRAARKGPATGADQAPGPHSHSSASS